MCVCDVRVPVWLLFLFVSVVEKDGGQMVRKEGGPGKELLGRGAAKWYQAKVKDHVK